MAGFGLWLSRVGWQEQMAGEHPYGYANNNPMMYIDPYGMSPQTNGSPTVSIGNGGSGNSCPGSAAYNLIVATFSKNKACLQAIQRVCPYGFAAEVAQVPFMQCKPVLKKGESGTACMNNPSNPPPRAQTGKDKQGNQSSCFVGYICVNPDVCSGKNLPKGATAVGRLAGDLLFEMMNWCNCKYHSQFGGEQPANDVIDVCKIPGDTGEHGGGFD
jgi:hypothetical protein